MLEDLKIDPEFASQIPPLTPDELEQLEANILQDGVVINPIIIWNGVIVDGHNRYHVLVKYPEIHYSTFEKTFADRNEVMAWICKNQLGRRNLTADQKKYLIGKQYKAERASHGGNRGTIRDEKTGEFTASSEIRNLRSGIKTCERIAKENHVGKTYVMDARNYADGVDAAEEVIPGTRQEILSGEICPIESAVKAVAQAPPDKREELANHLRDPEVQRRKKHRERKEETEDERIMRQIAKEMRSGVPQHKIDEHSMLGTLQGIANTMIRNCDSCFRQFPTLLTEQTYRNQVLDILKEPKEYITNLENGGNAL